MFKRDYNWRRHQELRMQRQRLHRLLNTWWGDGPINPRHLGRLKKSHFGCGCPACKPWRWKLEPKYKVSERRKIQNEE